MLPSSQNLLMHKVPDSVAAAARAAGITDDSCLFSMQSDLAPDGTARRLWLVVAKDTVVALDEEHPEAAPAAGPFKLSTIEKVRSFQVVGSAFMQFLTDGVYVNVIRYSNARREQFSRARNQLQRLVKGESVQDDALTRPSEVMCQKCGLPLPGRRTACPRCGRHHGLFFRSGGLMRPYSKSIAFLFCVMLAGVALDLLPPQLQRILVDDVLNPRQHIDWLPLILLGLVTASAVRCVLTVLIGRTTSIVGTRITKDLRERLERKLLSLSVDYYNRYPSGQLMSRVMYDVDYFQGFVNQVASGFLLNVMLVLGVGTVLFFMNWRLAFLVMLPVPFVVVGTIFFWRHIYPRYYRFWESQSKMVQLLSGFLSGIRLVKAFGQEDREQKRFAFYAAHMQTSRRRLETGQATFNPIMAFVFGLGGLIVWYAGGRKVFGQEITLGTLMAFFSYLGLFYAPISSLSMFSNWLTGFLSAAQRVFEVLDSEAMLAASDNPIGSPAMKGRIEFRGVTFGYDLYTPVLKNISFTVEPGQFIGIVGKSGAGKTTVVNLICRFHDVQQGSVLIDGDDVRDIDPGDLHRQVGLVLQEPFLFRGSIADNIAYGRPNSTPWAIMDAAKAANAHQFISRRAAAYDTKLGEQGAGLSGGERQRISIARALLCDPRILILDEATSSVDTESEQEIQKALVRLCKGRTTIAIAHRLSTLKNADRIVVIDEGQIAEAGSHEELMALKDGIYQKLVRIQTELTRLEL